MQQSAQPCRGRVVYFRVLIRPASRPFQQLYPEFECFIGGIQRLCCLFDQARLLVSQPEMATEICNDHPHTVGQLNISRP